MLDDIIPTVPQMLRLQRELDHLVREMPVLENATAIRAPTRASTRGNPPPSVRV